MSYDITGTAEGTRERERDSQPGSRSAASAGWYVRCALAETRTREMGAGDIHRTRDGHYMASALIDVDARGHVASVSVPSDPIEGGRWQVPRKVAAAELESLLKN